VLPGQERRDSEAQKNEAEKNCADHGLAPFRSEKSGCDGADDPGSGFFYSITTFFLIIIIVSPPEINR
jgi:hypothetical protein